MLSTRWTGPSALGTRFARGKLPDPELVTRLLTPRRLLDVLMRRSLSPPQVRCLTNGTELHPRDYIAETTSRRGQAIPMVDMHRLSHLLESGCTLVIDAINVQLAGEKSWDVRTPSRPVPLYRDAAPNSEPSNERAVQGR